MKVILVELYNKKAKNEFLENIMVFETLKQAETFIRETMKKEKYYFVVFERDVGILNKEQLQQLQEFNTLDDFDYVYGNDTTDKLILRLF